VASIRISDRHLNPFDLAAQSKAPGVRCQESRLAHARKNRGTSRSRQCAVSLKPLCNTQCHRASCKTNYSDPLVDTSGEPLLAHGLAAIERRWGSTDAYLEEVGVQSGEIDMQRRPYLSRLRQLDQRIDVRFAIGIDS
jgi:hypothetical protein